MADDSYKEVQRLDGLEVVRGQADGIEVISGHVNGHSIYTNGSLEPDVHHGLVKSWREKSRLPCGLSPIAFCTIVAIITALVVGGAVGGGMASLIGHDRWLGCAPVERFPRATADTEQRHKLSGRSPPARCDCCKLHTATTLVRRLPSIKVSVLQYHNIRYAHAEAELDVHDQLRNSSD